MIKVSVVVPVYNVEEYIERCLESLVNQTLKDIEIIVVNDGSPDNSQLIIDKYVEKHPEIIRSFIKENGGLSDARNFGINKAQGEYIGFLDSDDWVEPDMYETMYNKAKENNFDVVVCDLKYVYDSYTVPAYSNVTNDLNSKEDIKKSMLNIYPSAWNKIYHNSLFNNGVMFKEKVWFEDVEFLFRLFPYINSIGVVKKPFVNYVQRDGAITKTFNEKLFDYIHNWNGIIEFYKSKALYKEYEKELEYCYVRYIYGTFIKSATNYNDKDKYKQAVFFAISNVKKQFPNYRRNKYFYKMGLKGIYFILFNKVISKLVPLLVKMNMV